jgi:hypothetical protein
MTRTGFGFEEMPFVVGTQLSNSKISIKDLSNVYLIIFLQTFDFVRSYVYVLLSMISIMVFTCGLSL